MDFDTKELIMGLSVLVAFLALLVTFSALRVSKKAQEQSRLSFDLSNSNTLLGYLKVKEVNGQELTADFSLLNHGEKKVVLKKVELSGRGESAVGEDYGILDDIFYDEGPKIVEGGKELSFETKFLVGVGKLKKLNLDAHIKGIDAYHKEFWTSIPVEVQMS